MSEPDRHAREQLSADYQRIMAPDYSRRWDGENPGNRAINEERDAVLGALVRVLPTRPVDILDLGCGSLSILPHSIDVRSRIGLDLLFGRLAALRQVESEPTPTVNGNGAALPFVDAAFDVVVLSTMMTSVLDPATRHAVGAEVERVLRPGGAMLWYDMRMPNPRNDATRAVGTRELRKLFPSLRGDIRSLTVVPDVARRLGSRTPQLYGPLRRVPLLRSHLAACLVKPS